MKMYYIYVCTNLKLINIIYIINAIFIYFYLYYLYLKQISSSQNFPNTNS